ncbi:hypothetical protein WH47_07044 [Habropoda laboriosa]|uniref:Uncharacterized protein n=1 Tax=Habropoda laboriosa TaxID=597456 RepID=A0A0L7RG78_9HYME|nr:hypothetical protein WH47_07044 [Habropoda laboriosa]
MKNNKRKRFYGNFSGKCGRMEKLTNPLQISGHDHRSVSVLRLYKVFLHL